MRIETIGDATLYLADCREVLPTLGHVPAIVTDPPYGIGESGAIARRRRAAAASDPVRQRGARHPGYGDFEWDKSPPPGWLIQQLLSMSDWQIIFGGNFFALPPAPCWLVWDKQNSGDFADAELAWTNLDKAVRLIQWRWNGMIRKGSDVREHPTQKPEGVMCWAVDHLPPEADTILDPFMGSGSTGVAAIKRGRRFIGIEVNERYFEVACRRLEEAPKQADMLLSAAQ